MELNLPSRWTGSRANATFWCACRNHQMTFGLFFETSLAAFLTYCPGLDHGLRMYPLR